VVHPRFAEPPRAGLLFNLNTGRVLWQRAPKLRLPIASLTKMMTALLVAQSTTADARVPITREALEYQGSGVGELPYGRRVSVRALLAGLLLPSGNDAAIALAQYVSGTVPRFVALMNEHAAELGLDCTHYSSPSGYYDEDNGSCAADLAVLASLDLRQPRIASLTARASVAVAFPIKGGRLFLNSNNPLVLEHYPGVTGLKTGFTTAAGLCLVATAERHGVRLGVVLLHSPNPGEQAAELLDRAFTGIYRLPA
jgi:D-alanyl-D-alanine carboxypeptidase (penicillin-binding protein 5/6)